MSILHAKVKYVDGLQFVATTGSGHVVAMDGTVEHGGLNSAPRPMEMLIAGLGGCTGMDIISVLKKKRQDVTSFELHITGTRAETDPMRYTVVDIQYIIRGRGVSEEAVKRSIELSTEKYCSVKATLTGNTDVRFSYKIEEQGG